MSRKGRNRTGFTLVELLVALTISSILILGLYSATRAGWQLWRKAELQRPGEDSSQRIMRMLRREFAGAYLPPEEEGAPKPFEFVENRDRGELTISFCTTMPSYRRGLPPGRCARVTYEYRKDDAVEDKGGVLTRKEELLAGERVISEPISDVIATGLKEFSLVCLDQNGRRYDADQRSARLPRTVAVTMSWPMGPAVDYQQRVASFSSSFLISAEAPLSESE